MINNRIVLNVDAKYINDLIPVLDNNNYFELSNQNCPRKELFNFALALGYKRGYPTELEKRVSLIRREIIANENYLYMSVFFKESLSDDLDKIDMITDENKVYSVVENYVNTGLSVLKDYLSDMNEEQLLFSLMSEMDEAYNEYKEDHLSDNKSI